MLNEYMLNSYPSSPATEDVLWKHRIARHLTSGWWAWLSLRGAGWADDSSRVTPSPTQDLFSPTEELWAEAAAGGANRTRTCLGVQGSHVTPRVRP